MINYAPNLPRDKDGNILDDFPAPKVALAQYVKENGIISSVISVTHDTTALEVTALGNAAILRWVPTTDTEASVVGTAAGANFDHAVPAFSIRRFVIPIESNPETGSVQGVNRELGLYQRFAVKSIGNASVLTAEF